VGERKSPNYAVLSSFHNKLVDSGTKYFYDEMHNSTYISWGSFLPALWWESDSQTYVWLHMCTHMTWSWPKQCVGFQVRLTGIWIQFSSMG